MTAKQIEVHRCRAAREVIGAHHHIVKIEECIIQGRFERAKIGNPGPIIQCPSHADEPLNTIRF